MPPKLTKKERREAALRILTGKSTQVDEARAAGVTKARMHQVVAEAKAEIEASAAAAAPAPAADPPPGAPPAAEKPSAVDEALRAAGIKKDEKPLTPEDLKKAAATVPVEDEKLVMSLFAGGKAYLVGGACEILGLQKYADQAAALRPATREVIKENVAELAADFRKSVGGNLNVVYAFLAGDLVLTGLALFVAWRKERKKAPAAPPPAKPKPEDN